MTVGAAASLNTQMGLRHGRFDPDLNAWVGDSA